MDDADDDIFLSDALSTEQNVSIAFFTGLSYMLT